MVIGAATLVNEVNNFIHLRTDFAFQLLQLRNLPIGGGIARFRWRTEIFGRMLFG